MRATFLERENTFLRIYRELSYPISLSVEVAWSEYSLQTVVFLLPRSILVGLDPCTNLGISVQSSVER